MNLLLRAAAQALDVLHTASIDACVIGGVAVARWGEPRLTADVDLVAMSAVIDDVKTVDALLSVFAPRSQGAREFALAHRVLLLRDAQGIPLDISLGALEFERAMVVRATAWRVENCPSVLTCCDEDLVVTKAFSGRDRDWADIAGVISRQSAALDQGAILERLTPLAEFAERPESISRLQLLFDGR